MRYLQDTLKAAFVYSLSRNHHKHVAPLALSRKVEPSEKPDNIILDGVGLATTTDDDAVDLKEFRPKGLFIDPIVRGDKTDYKIKTKNNDYELTTLEQIDRVGLHAKSYLTSQSNSYKAKKNEPDSLRIAIGGTRDQDWGRTFAMHVTKMPIHYEKHLREFVDKTLDTYSKNYPEAKLPKDIVVSGHSAGATHANKVFEILSEKNIPNVHLHLYEPFGAKFSKLKPEHQEKAVSYRTHNSFLERFPLDGDTIGREKKLPPSSVQKKVSNGMLIAIAEGLFGVSIEGHKIPSIIDSALDGKVLQEVKPLKEGSRSMPNLTSYVSQYAKGMSRNLSAGVIRA